MKTKQIDKLNKIIEEQNYKDEQERALERAIDIKYRNKYYYNNISYQCRTQWGFHLFLAILCSLLIIPLYREFINFDIGRKIALSIFGIINLAIYCMAIHSAFKHTKLKNKVREELIKELKQ